MNLQLNLKELQLRFFSYRNFCQIPSKIFATPCFFTDHSKPLKKATCRTPSANACQLCAHYLH